MKKLWFVTILVFMGFTGLLAQTAGEMSLGARGGLVFAFHDPHPNFKTYMNANGLDTSSLVNLNLSLFLSYTFRPQFSMQIETDFMFFQGLKGTFNSRSIEMNYSSMDVPLLFKYSFIDSSVRAGAQAGPYLTFPLGQVNTRYAGYTNTDTSNVISAFMPGFILGGYAGFPIGTGILVVDGRFIFDLSHSTEEPGFGFMYRRGFSVSVGYEFKISA